MRDFNDADRKKKRGRIELPANPGNLSEEAMSQLEASVRGAVRDGYVACPAGWKIARELGCSRLDVGVMIDKLGIRVTDCQLGCFKISKTASAGESAAQLGAEVARRIASLGGEEQLTCANIFALASELKLKPLTLAESANYQGYKIKGCQLGCF